MSPPFCSLKISPGLFSQVIPFVPNSGQALGCAWLAPAPAYRDLGDPVRDGIWCGAGWEDVAENEAGSREVLYLSGWLSLPAKRPLTGDWDFQDLVPAL